MATTNKRQLRFSKKLIDNNLEYDYLANVSLTFNSDVENEYLFMIPTFYENRSDLISHKFYGTVELWWLICERNDIFDPFTEFSFGKEIIIPSVVDYQKFISDKIKVRYEYGDYVFTQREIKAD